MILNPHTRIGVGKKPPEYMAGFANGLISNIIYGWWGVNTSLSVAYSEKANILHHIAASEDNSGTVAHFVCSKARCFLFQKLNNHNK